MSQDYNILASQALLDFLQSTPISSSLVSKTQVLPPSEMCQNLVEERDKRLKNQDIELQQLRINQKQLEEENSTLATIKRRAELETQVVKDQNQITHLNLTKAKQEYKSCIQERKEIEEKWNQVKEEKENILDALDSSERTRNTVESKAQKCEEDRTQIEKLWKEKTRAEQECQKKYTLLTEELGRQRAQHNTETQGLELQISAKEEDFTRLQAEIEEKKATIERQAITMERINQQIQSLDTDLSECRKGQIVQGEALSHQEVDTQQHIRSLEATRDRLQRELLEKETKSSECDESKRQLERDYTEERRKWGKLQQDLEAKLQQETKEKENLRQELVQIRKSLADCETQTIEKGKLRQTLDAQSVQLKTCESKLQGIIQNLTYENERYRLLEKEKGRLENKIQLYKENETKNAEQIQNLENKILQIGVEMESSQNTSKELSAERNVIQSELASMRELLEKKETDLVRLKEQNEKLTEEEKDWNKNIENARVKVIALEKQLEKQKKALEKKQEEIEQEQKRQEILLNQEKLLVETEKNQKQNEQKQLLECEQKAQKSKASNQKLIKSVAKSKEETKQIKKELEQCETRLATLVNEHKKEIISLQSKYEECTIAKQKLEEWQVLANQDCDQIKTDLRECEGKVQVGVSTAEKLRLENQELKEANQLLETKNRELHQKVAQVTGGLEVEQEKQKKKAEEEESRRIQEVKQLEDNWRNCRERFADSERIRLATQATLVTQSQSIQDAKTVVQMRDQRVKEQEAISEKLRSELKTCRAQKTEAIHTRDAMIKQISGQNKTLIDANKFLQASNSAIQKQMNEAGQANQKLTEASEKSKAILQSQQQKLDQETKNSIHLQTVLNQERQQAAEYKIGCTQKIIELTQNLAKTKKEGKESPLRARPQEQVCKEELETAKESIQELERKIRRLDVNNISKDKYNQLLKDFVFLRKMEIEEREVLSYVIARVLSKLDEVCTNPTSQASFKEELTKENDELLKRFQLISERDIPLKYAEEISKLQA